MKDLIDLWKTGNLFELLIWVVLAVTIVGMLFGLIEPSELSEGRR